MKPGVPTVTAIIPTYNRARYIGEAIDSVLAQSRPVDEIIVVDDGSTDHTPERLKKYGNAIRYISQQNRGPGAARNRGMKEARGDLLAFLDSDDLWVPEKNARQVSFMHQCQQVEFSFGNMANFSSPNDLIIPEISNPTIHGYLKTHSGHVQCMLACLLECNIVPTPAVMFRRSCLQRIGYFDEQFRQAEDYAYWLKAATLCRWGFIDAVLVRRRRHAENLINDWAERKEIVARVLSGLQPTLPTEDRHLRRLLSRKLRQVHYDLGSHFLYRGDYAKASLHLRLGFPRWHKVLVWLAKRFAAETCRTLSSFGPRQRRS